VLDAGLALVPFALTITIAGFLAGRLTRRAPAPLVAAVTLGWEALALGLLATFHHAAAEVVLLIAAFGIGHGGTLAAQYVLLSQAVPPEAAGAAAGLASAVAGVSGAVASAVTTALLTSRLVRAGAAALPASSGYAHDWACGAAIAAVGALVVAAGAPRASTQRPRRT
jgi:MFS family permease